MTAPELQVDTEFLSEQGVTVASVAGSIDGHTFDVLESRLQEIFKDGCHKVVLDLSGVQYISSAGVGVFIGALHEVQERNGNIVLLGPSPDVREVLEILNLNVLMQITDDLDAALACFS